MKAERQVAADVAAQRGWAATSALHATASRDHSVIEARLSTH